MEGAGRQAPPLSLLAREQPAERFWKDEGGRANALRFSVASPVPLTVPLPLYCELLFEDGTPVRDGEDALTLQTPRDRMVLGPDVRQVTITFRIEKASRKMGDKKFCLHVYPVYPPTQPPRDGVTRGVVSTPINVMSKRPMGERETAAMRRAAEMAHARGEPIPVGSVFALTGGPAVDRLPFAEPIGLPVLSGPATLASVQTSVVALHRALLSVLHSVQCNQVMLKALTRHAGLTVDEPPLPSALLHPSSTGTSRAGSSSGAGAGAGHWSSKGAAAGSDAGRGRGRSDGNASAASAGSVSGLGGDGGSDYERDNDADADHSGSGGRYAGAGLGLSRDKDSDSASTDDDDDDADAGKASQRSGSGSGSAAVRGSGRRRRGSGRVGSGSGGGAGGGSSSGGRTNAMSTDAGADGGVADDEAAAVRPSIFTGSGEDRDRDRDAAGGGAGGTGGDDVASAAGSAVSAGPDSEIAQRAVSLGADTNNTLALLLSAASTVGAELPAASPTTADASMKSELGIGAAGLSSLSAAVNPRPAPLPPQLRAAAEAAAIEEAVLRAASGGGGGPTAPPPPAHLFTLASSRLSGGGSGGGSSSGSGSVALGRGARHAAAAAAAAAAGGGGDAANGGSGVALGRGMRSASHGTARTASTATVTATGYDGRTGSGTAMTAGMPYDGRSASGAGYDPSFTSGSAGAPMMPRTGTGGSVGVYYDTSGSGSGVAGARMPPAGGFVPAPVGPPGAAVSGAGAVAGPGMSASAVGSWPAAQTAASGHYVPPQTHMHMLYASQHSQPGSMQMQAQAYRQHSATAVAAAGAGSGVGMPISGPMVAGASAAMVPGSAVGATVPDPRAGPIMPGSAIPLPVAGSGTFVPREVAAPAPPAQPAAKRARLDGAPAGAP